MKVHMCLICLDCCLRLSNFVFTGIFVLEAIVKIIALRTHYFKKAWNVFDFVIVISSLVGMEFKHYLYHPFGQQSLVSLFGKKMTNIVPCVLKHVKKRKRAWRAKVEKRWKRWGPRSNPRRWRNVRVEFVSGSLPFSKRFFAGYSDFSVEESFKGTFK